MEILSSAQIYEDEALLRRISKPGLNELNINFLIRRISDRNLNEAIDIARIAWDQFPKLRESAETKELLELLMEGLQEKMNAQVLVPFGNTMAAVTAIINRLDDLVRTNPSLIEQGFNRTMEGFRIELSTIRTAIQDPTAKIFELNQLMNQLVYKPIAKGNAGEVILTELWTEHFTRDQIEKLGGAGREDLLVRAYLGDNDAANFGEAISIERKTGKQKYGGSAREEAVRHAKERGASVAMLIYDTPENLPQSIRPVSISKEQGVLVIVADMLSGTWKLMRETIEIIQRVTRSSSKDIAAINVEAIQEVVTELGNMVKLIEQIKGNNTKIKSCADEVEQNVITIKALVKSYQDRLNAAIIGRTASSRTITVGETSSP